MKLAVIFLSLLFVGALCSTWTSKSNVKQLAGPPEEFSLHSLPQASQIGVDTFNDVVYIFFSEDPTNEEKLIWNGLVQVDSGDSFSFAITTPIVRDLDVTLLSPQNAVVPLPTPVHDKLRLGDGSAAADLTTWYFNTSLPTGNYTVSLAAKASDVKNFRNTRRPPFFLFGLIPDGLVLTWNKSPVSMYSHLMNLDTVKGKTIGIRAMFMTAKKGVTKEKQVLFEIDERELDIELPNGTSVALTMEDDGLHNDLEANDGIYGASMVAPLAGVYAAKPILRAKNAAGVEIRRSTVHLINVVDDSIELSGLAWMKKKSDDLLAIYVEVQQAPDTANQTFRPYAELWGWTVQGESEVEVPICWLSTITPVEANNGKNVLALQLDPKWVKRVNAFGPFTLKNFYVQETKSYTPVLSKSELKVKSHPTDHHEIKTMLQGVKFNGEITKEMREGRRPPHHILKVLNKNIFKQNYFTDVEEKDSMNSVLSHQDGTTSRRKSKHRAVRNESNSGKLLLVHGYCSDSNPWEESTFNWTNPVAFLNPSASITNDLFARKMLELTSDFLSFSIIAHSQGGLAATHLHNYYFSGLEFAEGGRLVQSVGSPYKGSTLAGVLAMIGEVFGLGCGPNVDLARDGAELWLKGISNHTRQDIYYYTTTYKESFFGGYCILGENLLILTPNDGTAELPLTVLEGANNMGNTEGWCHTDAMSYPPQTHDPARNTVMNSMAAR